MDIIQAMDIFITAKRADGLAERTIADYRRVFRRYVKHVDPDLDSWDRSTARDYAAYINGLSWASATKGIHIRYLRSFWGWLYREGLTAEDLSAAVAAPKPSIKDEPLITTSEFKRLVEACDGDRWAVRDRAILLMLADTGMRRSEITSLSRSQVTFEDGGAWIMLPGETTKNGKERYVFLGQASAAALRAYLDARTDDRQALFISERGPLGGEGIAYMLKRRARIAGMDPARIHPHLLRKIFATWWIENGGDEQRLMKIGGWSGPEMLRIYVRLGSREKLQDAHKQYGPVDNVLEES